MQCLPECNSRFHCIHLGWGKYKLCYLAYSRNNLNPFHNLQNITACKQSKEVLVMIRDRVAECYTFCGKPVWKLQEKFGHKFGLQAGILALQDGSFVLYHYSAVVDTGVEVALVDCNGFSVHWFHHHVQHTKLCSSSHQYIISLQKAGMA